MADEKAQDDSKPKKPGLVKRLWTKSGIQPIFILLAMKGALPTTIALAAYESLEWAGIYTTLGYLVAIISHLSLCIQPRAKFTQSTIVSLFFVCLGAALALLQIQCVVAARQNFGTTSTGTSGSSEQNAFDSSANATAAVFLFVWVFVANIVRSARPQITLPIIQFSIFTIITSIYSPSFPDMATGMSFIRRLLITFLTGYAIATGVSFFVLPMTSRNTVEKQMGGMLKILKGCLASHSAFLRSIEATPTEDGTPQEKENAKKLRTMIITAGELFGKIKLELGFARKEIAFGKLSGQQYSQLYEKIRLILQPVMGLSTFLQIMKTTRERRVELSELPGAAEAIEAIKKLECEQWEDVMKLSREPYDKFLKAVFSGLDHIAIQLEFEKKPKKSQSADLEKEAGSTPAPGDAGFVDYLAAEIDKYQDHRNEVIQDWAESRDIMLPTRFWSRQMEKPPIQRHTTAVQRQILNQNQLYLVLYINFLNYSVGQSILGLVRWVDARHEDGTMSKRRFINPGIKRIRKLFRDAFKHSDADETLSADVNGGTNVFLGDALKAQKDPEHLEPTNFYEKSTDYLRAIPRLLSSESAAFAFRAAVAAMSIGIIAYLRETRTFFLQQRGVWAMIMTAISMDPHAGQGIFGFACRVFGTVVAMVASIVIWFMCDHNHAAILVVFWIYMSIAVLFLLVRPQYAMVAMISSITVVLVIGYELQVGVIGVAAATANGQEAYPTQILAPYRLATVVIGLGVAFVWTYFPYPMTTHGALRRDLGSTVYILANYYSCVHTTVDARLRLGPAIHDLPENSPINKLNSARQKVFGKVLLMLTRLDEHQRFAKFEVPIGGRFPKETYKEMVDCTRNIFTYLSLITYSSSTFIQLPEGDSDEDQKAIEEERRWLEGFREFAANTKVTSHSMTTNLCLLSSAIRSGQPLPPYLNSPRPFISSDRVVDSRELDTSLLSAEHFAHPCYTAFAVGEVASAFVTAEMAKLIKLTKQLVGEVDFSFHVVSTADDGSSTASTLWDSRDDSPSGSKKKGD